MSTVLDLYGIQMVTVFCYHFRPKDGRMTVTKTCGGTTCKKVFPQILICQLFRWPHIVFHHDIKSSENCLHPGSVKPAMPLNTSTGKYSNHLNTGQFGCLVFKWLSHVTWRTIQIPDNLDHQTFFSPVFRPTFEYRTI